MALNVDYESEGFAASSTIPNGPNSLSTTWDDILWAAVTVGRPDRYHIFRDRRLVIRMLGSGTRRTILYGDYEALFRWSLVRMALEQRSASSHLLHLTESMKSLDRTEKGMVNYFLGMTFCKLFASELLGTPWLLHLDVFRDQLGIVLRQGSRPDLVGEEHASGRWHGFECKGRMRPMSDGDKKKAKAQASRLISVKGITCSLHIGSVSYFRREILNFYWRDPPQDGRPGIELELPEDAWEYYYRPVSEIIAALREEDAVDTQRTRRDSENNLFVRVAQCDLEIGVHQAVEEHLVSGRWTDARVAAREQTERLRRDGFHADGLQIRAGETWNERYEEPPTPRLFE